MDLVKVLSDAGLNVNTSYYRTPARGSFNPVGVIWHHTAGGDNAPSLRLLRDGRPGVPGPLCQIGIRKSGECYVITNGRANHAGSGSGHVLNEVRANIAPSGNAYSRGLSDTTNGNGYFYGIEVVNLGNGSDPYPDAQLDALVRCATAICQAQGWHYNRNIHHREWSRRKPDMSWPGNPRLAVQQAMAGKPPKEELEYMDKSTQEKIQRMDNDGLLDDFINMHNDAFKKHGATPTTLGHIVRFYRGIRDSAPGDDPLALGQYVGHGANQGAELDSRIKEVGSSIRGLVHGAIELIRKN